jgi:hypothetical protein
MAKDTNAKFVATLAKMDLDQIVMRVMVLTEMAGEEENRDVAAVLAAKRDCAECVGKLRFGHRYADAVEAAA